MKIENIGNHQPEYIGVITTTDPNLLPALPTGHPSFQLPRENWVNLGAICLFGAKFVLEPKIHDRKISIKN